MLITMLACLLAAAGFSAFNLADVLQRERTETIRKKAVAIRYIYGMDVANSFENELSEMEHNLHNCTKTMAMALENKVTIQEDNRDHTPLSSMLYADKAHAPSSFREYPQYASQLDFDHMIYLDKPECKPADKAQRLAAAKNTFCSVRDMMLESMFNTRLTLANRDFLLYNMTHNKVPITLVSFSFTDGFYICYPGEYLKQEFDPRKRAWFQTRTAPDAPISGWSKPYLDYSRNMLGITYSIRMESGKGEIMGVSAFILDISHVLEVLLNSRKNDPCLREKVFLDASGSVIVSSDPEINHKASVRYSMAYNSGESGFTYPNEKLLKKIFDEQNGFYEETENGRRFVYIFIKCAKLNWYYVEKVDLTAAMEMEQQAAE